MLQLILIFHVLFAVALIGLVLIQKGKGAGMGAAFGSGASQTVFGSKGSGGFLLKITVGIAALFFMTSIALTYLAARQVKQSQASGAVTRIDRITDFSKHMKEKKQAPKTEQQPTKKIPAKK